MTSVYRHHTITASGRTKAAGSFKTCTDHGRVHPPNAWVKCGTCNRTVRSRLDGTLKRHDPRSDSERSEANRAAFQRQLTVNRQETISSNNAEPCLPKHLRTIDQI